MTEENYILNDLAQHAIEKELIAPPTEKEIHAQMPCRFSCCKDLHNHWVDDFYFTPTATLSKVNDDGTEDIIPATMLIARNIQDRTSGRLLKVLFDSGSTRSMINQKALPRNCQPMQLNNPIRANTIQGTFESKEIVIMESIILPEFHRSLKVDKQSAYVFTGPCNYDIILGRDFCRKAGIQIDFKDNIIKWMNKTIIMKTPNEMQSTTEQYNMLTNNSDDELEELIEENYAISIDDADYRAVDVQDVANAQKHLTKKQQKELGELLGNFQQLFSGKLGRYKGRKIHLEVQPGATPIHARPYAVPRTQQETFKKELMHLVDSGVLRPIGATQWASPTFIQPKKDNKVRWLSDFRELNKVLKRRVYPLPNILEVLMKRTGYKFFTKLDISMCYYTFELDQDSQELCTIVTPFGKFAYNRLAMGLTCAPDHCQEIMEDLFRDVEDSDVFIDDIGNFSQTWEDHLQLLHKVLTILQDNGFTVNPRKCEWAVSETDWLGYWLTPDGLKPWHKKVEAILKMDRPRNIKQLRAFLGAVGYYRDMWPRKSHVLKPLTDLTGKGKFNWTSDQDKAFQEMKSLVASEAFSAYPDHTKPFEIYTDASDYQLGAAILQEGRPIAYYSKKLSSTQQNYSTMEKELLAIVTVLNAFRSMLLGTNITIYTDHKNLTYNTLNNRRVLKWRLALEDFGAKFIYIEGKNNILADAFSRLPRIEGKTSSSHNNTFNTPNNNNTTNESYMGSWLEDEELVDCFVNFPPQPNLRNPLELQWIQAHQFEDQQLNEMHQRNPERYPTKYINAIPLICYKYSQDTPESEWKICIPTLLLNDVIVWYHHILGHAGQTRMYDSIRTLFYHPQLKQQIERFKCPQCQRLKLQGRSHGHLPEREAILMPFEEVHVDLVGPWRVEVNDNSYEIMALTCIEPVTNLVELIQIQNKTSRHVAQQFENCWLSRYPWPQKCIHDNGGEFIGWEFQLLCERANIRHKETTSYNPQANAICERMHQTVGNILRTLIHSRNINNEDEIRQVVDQALATAMHATRTAVSRSLNYNSPGSLVFHRDMFLNIPLQADFLTLQATRQLRINQNLMRQNAKRWNHDYRVGDKILIRNKGGRKMDVQSEGPFEIVQVFTNGTVSIRRRPNVLERINIRRLSPFRE